MHADNDGSNPLPVHPPRNVNTTNAGSSNDASASSSASTANVWVARAAKKEEEAANLKAANQRRESETPAKTKQERRHALEEKYEHERRGSSDSLSPALSNMNQTTRGKPMKALSASGWPSSEDELNASDFLSEVSTTSFGSDQ